jgi:hypothetical protein
MPQRDPVGRGIDDIERHGRSLRLAPVPEGDHRFDRVRRQHDIVVETSDERRPVVEQ